MSRFRSALVCLATAIVVATSGGVTAQAAETSQASASDVTAAASSGCGKAPTLNSGKHNIQSSGQNRSYILKVPANYDRNKPHKLIFGNHWLGGTAEQVAGGGSDGAPAQHRTPRRVLDHRRAITRGGQRVGRPVRRRLSVCSGGPGADVRPGVLSAPVTRGSRSAGRPRRCRRGR
jgi:hypothetical protein